MLQRAASNAYSWWWAGHIRTKQSKWLEQSMQDMEEKVDYALKLIQEDGDTFAKRAEMYYKKRPELISFVEEAFRAFRALAERYDSLSTDLQKANTTIATCLPEQVQFAMDEEDDFFAAKHAKSGHSQQRPPAPNLPKVPNRPMKSVINDASKKLEAKTLSKAPTTKIKPAKSGLTKSEALEEIDKLQKDILASQTMKEYVKSSYENGISIYWRLENEIMEKQDKVIRLQDEFGVSTLIDDNDARTLMAEAAIKSCQDTLAQLQDKQEKSAEEAQVENRKIEDARQRLKSLKQEFFSHQAGEVERADQSTDHQLKELQISKQDMVGPERQKLEALREKIKEQFRAGTDGSLSVSELVDKIDDLVNMVINLESSVLSQTVLIDRLKTEADDFHSQIQSLEDDKATLLDGRHELERRVKEMEEKLYSVQNLNKNVIIQNTDLHTHFTEVHCSLDQLSEKLQSVQPDEKIKETSSLQEDEDSNIEAKSQAALTKQIKEEEGGDSELISKISATEVKEDRIQKNFNAPSVNSDNLEKGEKVDSTQNKEASDSGLDFETSGTEQRANGTEQNLRASIVGSNNSGKMDKRDESEVISSISGTEEKGNNIERSLSALATETPKGDDAKSFGESETGGVSEGNGMPEIAERSPSTEQKNLETFEDELNWKQLLLNGLEDKERILLAEYTAILRNYKEVKKKLSDEEKKNETLFETTLQLRDMKSSVTKKDQEIQSLRQKLNLVQQESGGTPEAGGLAENEVLVVPPAEEEEEEIKFLINQRKTISAVEEKLREKIDAILDENLDFWLRFSGAFHQVQKFKTEVQDLQDEITQLKKKEEKKQDGKSHSSIPRNLTADVRAVCKHLSEKKTELTVWLEQSNLLKDELHRRISSISDIQEAITVSLREGVETEEITFSTHQAAKFQGEALSMKQENNKVNEELVAGIDHIIALRNEIEKTLDKLDAEFKSSFTSHSRSKIPLRSFLFGMKEKRHKHSIFSYMHHSSKKASSP
ncbi:NAB domain-containing protein [Heracleum sosnowskyi]|uniref:NAB domain-containing protein n=1 Tax=Heracleum sosnowskyi TaxID=360622 RepID=A0AAD8HQ69_9APIA|nr:NAB domain-containing protein [Heracleum sosnowskyi]